MAEITTHTLNDLTIEALKQAGYPNAVADDTLQTRSEIWFEEFKSDIWHASRQAKFKILETERFIGMNATSGTSNDEGLGIYNNPTNFAHPLSMQLLEGTHYGTLQNGTDANTIKLAATASLSATDAVGKEIFVWLIATPTTCASAFIRNFNASTKVAELHTSLPYTDLDSAGANYYYLVADTTKPIINKDIWSHDEDYKYAERGTPREYHIINDTGGLGASAAPSISTINPGGQFLLYPIPYFNSDGKLRVLRQKYYANLTRIDNADNSAGKVMNEIFLNWRVELTQFIVWKALKSDRDERANSEFAIWREMRANLISSVTLGVDLSDLQFSVEA
jgi:hypothetical protein